MTAGVALNLNNHYPKIDSQDKNRRRSLLICLKLKHGQDPEEKGQLCLIIVISVKFLYDCIKRCIWLSPESFRWLVIDQWHIHMVKVPQMLQHAFGRVRLMGIRFVNLLFAAGSTQITKNRFAMQNDTCTVKTAEVGATLESYPGCTERTVSRGLRINTWSDTLSLR